MRRLLKALLLVGILAYLCSLLAVYVVSRQDDRSPADAIVVLGAAQYNGRPSPVLRARLDHAATLYLDGRAPLIVVTGGVGRGDRQSEATVGHRYLRALRIPDSVVIVQPAGRSTEESMRAVSEWMDDRDLHSAILVSDPFHMLRLRFEARRFDIEAHTSPTRSSPISGSAGHELRYLALEALKAPAAWVRSW
ncbi:MAG: YdcF family protein [Gemmatimonadota bacterium]